MACFRGTLLNFLSPEGALTKFETLTGAFSNFANPDGEFSAFDVLTGSVLVVCPIDVAGPHSLCLDDGSELWYADEIPIDFE